MDSVLRLSTQYSTVQYSTVQYSTVQYSTVQYSTVRPICLLPTFSKLTEGAVHFQLLDHLESTKQLHRDHHAYRDKLNTTTALLQITTMMYKSTDQNKVTATMSVDMSAAFDCIRHNLILRKLPYYNIGEHTCNWIRDYLHYRSNYVEIGNKQS